MNLKDKLSLAVSRGFARLPAVVLALSISGVARADDWSQWGVPSRDFKVDCKNRCFLRR